MLSSILSKMPTHPMVCLTDELKRLSRYSMGVETPALRHLLAKNMAAMIHAGTVNSIKTSTRGILKLNILLPSRHHNKTADLEN
jgi:hypothetical protein